MIQENYISYEIAKLLKEKGFEQEPDYATSWYANQYYKNACQGEWFEGEHQIIEDIDDKCNISYLSERGIFIPAPTQSVAMKWLREIHHLDIIAPPQFDNSKWTYSAIIFKLSIPCTEIRLNDNKDKKEEACEAAIKYCLENLI